jgi:spermidine/putrescine transport system ATP-binding protein
MVFQNYALFPHMTVGENLSFPLEVRGMSRDERETRIGRALDMVQMGQFRNRRPSQLSGGQQQRIALARALVFDPQLVLMDEPLGALDKQLREHMQFEIKALHDRLGITVVYVTHDQGEALSMSNRVAIMRDGRIAQLGTPEELYFDPASEFVAQFIGRSNLIPVDFREEAEGPVARIAGATFPQLTSSRSGPARLALRFEAIRVHPAEEDGGSLRGIVEDVLFLGTNLEVNVRCDGLNLIASVPASRTPSLTRGQPVGVTMDLSNARVFYG